MVSLEIENPRPCVFMALLLLEPCHECSRISHFPPDSNEFQWIDGSTGTFRKWNTGEPNNAGGAEDCVNTRSALFIWNDRNCDWKGPGYICKAKACEFTSLQQ